MEEIKETNKRNAKCFSLMPHAHLLSHISTWHFCILSFINFLFYFLGFLQFFFFFLKEQKNLKFVWYIYYLIPVAIRPLPQSIHFVSLVSYTKPFLSLSFFFSLLCKVSIFSFLMWKYEVNIYQRKQKWWSLSTKNK